VRRQELKVSKTAMAVAALLVLATGCGTTYLEGTEIEDTPDSRAIYDVVEAYRLAVEQRDVTTLMQLISPRYFENASTTAVDSDDYGYEALRERVLPLLQDNIKAVQLRLRLTRIEIRGERAHADYEFWMKFLYAEGGREGWRAKNDFNRLEFVREDDRWKISGGL